MVNLKKHERVRGNSSRIINFGDEVELRAGGEIAELIQRAVALRLHQQQPLAAALDLEAVVVVQLQPPGVRVEINQGTAERLLQRRRLEEVGGAVVAVEVHA